jgi:hypothetical protein
MMPIPTSDYPDAYDSFPGQSDEVGGVGGTDAVADWANFVTDAIEKTEHYAGQKGDTASSDADATLTARINYLIAASGGGLQATFANTAPSSPADNDLWIDTSTAPWQVKVAASGVFAVVGAYATGILQKPIDTTGTLANGVTLVYDSTLQKWKYGASSSPPSDPVAGTPGLRTLGTGAQQAAAGNDTRLSNKRDPNAHATTHVTTGQDKIPNVTTTTPGLAPAPGGTPSGTKYLNDLGAYADPAITAGGMSNPFVAQDDLLIADATLAGVRLPKGTDGQVVGVDPADHHVKFINAAASGTADHNHNDGSSGGAISGGVVDTYLEVQQSSAPAAPATDNWRIYARDVGGDGHLFIMDHLGVEKDVTTLLGKIGIQLNGGTVGVIDVVNLTTDFGLSVVSGTGTISLSGGAGTPVFSTATDGLVPGPSSSEDDASHVLVGDGTWLLASGLGGNATSIQGEPVNVATPSDGDVLTYDTTAGEWAPAAPSGGGSGNSLTDIIMRGATRSAPPVTSSWTLVNISTGSGLGNKINDVPEGLIMWSDGTIGNFWGFALETAPATPWTRTMAFMAQGPCYGTAYHGFAIRESSTTKFYFFGLFMDASGIGMGQQSYNAGGGFNANLGIGNRYVQDPIAHMRIGDDGTNITMEYSRSGYANTWSTVYSGSRTAFMTTPNQVGIVINNNNSGNAPRGAAIIASYG